MDHKCCHWGILLVGIARPVKAPPARTLGDTAHSTHIHHTRYSTKSFVLQRYAPLVAVRDRTEADSPSIDTSRTREYANEVFPSSKSMMPVQMHKSPTLSDVGGPSARCPKCLSTLMLAAAADCRRVIDKPFWTVAESAFAMSPILRCKH